MQKSIHIGTILGIPIDINYTWFVIFGLVTWTLALWLPSFAPGQSIIVYWIAAICTSVIFFGSLLLHELSHSYVAIKNNIIIKRITLFIFGGVANISKEPQDPKIELKIAIAGPVCSFVIFLFFYLLTFIFIRLGCPKLLVGITTWLSITNLTIVIFNMIPGFPLDGGRLLRAFLWGYFNDIKKATRIASSLGRAFAFLLMGTGFFFLFKGQLLNGIWLIFIGLFLQEAAESSYQQVLMQKALTGSKVSDIMSSNVITVSENMSLDLVIDNYFFKFRFTSFPVVDVSENLSGLITLHNIKDVPKEKWNSTYVREAMIPLKADLLTRSSTEVITALGQMVRNQVGRLIVIEDHKLIGILSQRDVMRLFEVRSDLTD